MCAQILLIWSCTYDRITFEYVEFYRVVKYLDIVIVLVPKS
jgi:hypothetical protein